MSERLESHPDIEVTLIPGSGGAFEIVDDGQLKYSKLKLGRFPTDDEVDQIAG